LPCTQGSGGGTVFGRLRTLFPLRTSLWYVRIATPAVAPRYYLRPQERKPQAQRDWLDEAMHGSRAECGES